VPHVIQPVQGFEFDRLTCHLLPFFFSVIVPEPGMKGCTFTIIAKRPQIPLVIFLLSEAFHNAAHLFNPFPTSRYYPLPSGYSRAFPHILVPRIPFLPNFPVLVFFPNDRTRTQTSLLFPPRRSGNPRVPGASPLNPFPWTAFYASKHCRSRVPFSFFSSPKFPGSV